MAMAGSIVNAVGTFTDEDIIKIAPEVANPVLDGWEFFVESTGVQIHRKYREVSGLYDYKIHGVMADLDPKLCAQVYVDWEYRKVWDTYVLDLHPIKHEATGLEGLYWAVDYPWPMSDRDYTFVRDMRMVEVDGVLTCVCVAKSAVFPNEPEKEGIIRVDDFQQACVLQSDGKTGSRAFMLYYDNPKGMIPTWLINWGAQTGVPQFLDMMRKAVFGYEKWLKDTGREAVKPPEVSLKINTKSS